MDIKEEIELFIGKIQKEFGLTQEQIAVEMGYGTTYISTSLGRGGNKKFLNAIKKFYFDKSNSANTLGKRIFFLLKDSVFPDPVRERIKDVFTYLQETYQLKEIYKRLDIDPYEGSDVFMGLKNPEELLDKLESTFNVNRNFIYKNEGKIIKEYTRSNAKAFEIQKEPYLVPFMPVKARAGYAESLNVEVFVNDLDKFPIAPGVDRHGAEWMYFEVDGDSMEPEFESKDWVLTSKVHQEDWLQIRDFYVYVIVTYDQVLLKRLYIMDEHHFVLVSDNEDVYPQRPIAIETIKELWLFRRHIKNRARPPKRFERKF